VNLVGGLVRKRDGANAQLGERTQLGSESFS